MSDDTEKHILRLLHELREEHRQFREEVHKGFAAASTERSNMWYRLVKIPHDLFKFWPTPFPKSEYLLKPNKEN